MLTLSHPADFRDFHPRTTVSHMALRTRNSGAESSRELFKGSKDLDFNLVTTENLSEIFSSCSWGPGPGNLSQNGLKPTPLMVSPTKKPETQTKIFSLQTRRLTESLSSAIKTAL